MAEPRVVVHLARQEGIGLGLDGIVEHEVAGPAADDDALHRAFEHLVVLQRLHAEGLLDALEESQRVLGLGQIANDGTARLDGLGSYAHGPGMQQLHVDEPQLLGNAEVDAVLGTVEVGVGRIDADVVLYGHAQASLHHVGVCHLLQSVEEQRMVADDEVAAKVNSLADDSLRHIETQQCP